MNKKLRIMRHILQGKPIISGVTFSDTIHLNADCKDTLIIDCTVLKNERMQVANGFDDYGNLIHYCIS